MKKDSRLRKLRAMLVGALLLYLLLPQTAPGQTQLGTVIPANHDVAGWRDVAFESLQTGTESQPPSMMILLGSGNSGQLPNLIKLQSASGANFIPGQAFTADFRLELLPDSFGRISKFDVCSNVKYTVTVIPANIPENVPPPSCTQTPLTLQGSFVSVDLNNLTCRVSFNPFPLYAGDGFRFTYSVTLVGDDPSDNTFEATNKVVSIPTPIICKVSKTVDPQLGRLGIIEGVFFKRPGVPEVPVITLNQHPAKVPAAVTPSPTQAKIQLSQCLASSQITVANIAGASTPYTVADPRPQITGLNPANAIFLPGDQLTLNVDHLCGMPAGDLNFGNPLKVKFGGVELPLLAETENSVTVRMPDALPRGRTLSADVILPTGSSSYEVPVGHVSIASINPLIQRPGGTLTLNLADVDARISTLTVKIGSTTPNTVLDVLNRTGNSIAVQIPTTLATGNYVLRVEAGFASAERTVFVKE